MLTIEIARKQIHFRSPRRPHEIQAWLEKDLSSVLNPLSGANPTTYQTSYNWAGLQLQIRLVYEAAFPKEDAYTFQMDCHASSLPNDLPALQRSANSWFSLWTREWKPDASINLEKSDKALYQSRAAEWLQIHESLQDPAILQTKILEATKSGATFSNSHKEGGTNIGFRENRWYRSEYGESDGYDLYRTPEDFLAFIRQYYDFETSRTLWPNKAPEPTVWRLIYRYLRAPSQ